jgi:hypothetical protein
MFLIESDQIVGRRFDKADLLLRFDPEEGEVAAVAVYDVKDFRDLNHGQIIKVNDVYGVGDLPILRHSGNDWKEISRFYILLKAEVCHESSIPTEKQITSLEVLQALLEDQKLRRVSEFSLMASIVLLFVALVASALLTVVTKELVAFATFALVTAAFFLLQFKEGLAADYLVDKIHGLLKRRSKNPLEKLRNLK